MRILKNTVTIFIYVVTSIIIIAYSFIDNGYSERIVYRIPNTNEKIVHLCYRFYEEIYFYNNDNYKFLLFKFYTTDIKPDDHEKMNLRIKYKIVNDTLMIYTLNNKIKLLKNRILNYSIENKEMKYKDWELIK